MGYRFFLVAGVVFSMILGACGSEETVGTLGPIPVAGPAVSTTVDPSGRIDADPHDGVAGEVVLTPAQIAYRDQVGLTDLETHDAFRYSCAIFGLPDRFVRFANQPPEEPAL